MRKQMMAVPADQYAAMQSSDGGADGEGSGGAEAGSGELGGERPGGGGGGDGGGSADGSARGRGEDQTPTLVLYEYDPTLQQPDAAAYEASMKAGYKPMPHVTLVRVDGSRHFHHV
jgi:hypothetical protein